MNAREHYEKAERLISLAEEFDLGGNISRLVGGAVKLNGLIQAAQVHATLALAATNGAHLPGPGEEDRNGE